MRGARTHLLEFAVIIRIAVVIAVLVEMGLGGAGVALAAWGAAPVAVLGIWGAGRFGAPSAMLTVT
jgi:hypothetical protein